MKQKAEEIKKAFEDHSSEAVESISKLAAFIEKCAMTPEAIEQMIKNTMKADTQHPEIEEIEGMSSKEYAGIYKRMSEVIAAEPEKFEEHARMSGMTAGELSTLFAQINGTIEKYPEVWESQENAHMLSPKNLKILVDVFRQ